MAEVAEAARHRSRRLGDDDVRGADLAVAMEGGHVRYVRRRHPEAAGRTATLRWLSRELQPGAAPLAARVGAADLGRVVLHPADDVADPAGHDDAAYAACAADLWVRCNELVPRL